MVRGFTVRNSGLSLAETDAGIYLDKPASGALIEGNRLENNLFGIYLHGARNALVRDNEVIGNRSLRMSERGNGIHLWAAKGSVVEGNSVRYGRDGIFVTTSRKNAFRNNSLSDLRFALHYMYTHDSEVSGNVSRDNHVGYALMYSDRLRVLGTAPQATATTVFSSTSPTSRASKATSCATPAPSASSSITRTATRSAAISSRAAPSASTSPPAPKATSSRATASSATRRR